MSRGWPRPRDRQPPRLRADRARGSLRLRRSVADAAATAARHAVTPGTADLRAVEIRRRGYLGTGRSGAARTTCVWVDGMASALTPAPAGRIGIETLRGSGARSTLLNRPRRAVRNAGRATSLLK